MAPKDGEKRIFVCNGQPIYNGHGRKLGAMVACMASQNAGEPRRDLRHRRRPIRLPACRIGLH
jgi:hypothetical protein